MITIWGVKFYEKPGSCGTCPFFSNGITNNPLSIPSSRGFCRLFEEMHHSWINPLRRCTKLFNKAFTYPEGTELGIVVNSENTEQEKI